MTWDGAERRTGLKDRRRWSGEDRRTSIRAEGPGGFKVDVRGGPWPILWMMVGMVMGLVVALVTK